MAWNPVCDTGFGTDYDYVTIKYSPDYTCTPPLNGDLNGDCQVDFFDFAIMALHWLEDNNE
jgi:hypothetical protein